MKKIIKMKSNRPNINKSNKIIQITRRLKNNKINRININNKNNQINFKILYILTHFNNLTTIKTFKMINLPNNNFIYPIKGLIHSIHHNNLYTIINKYQTLGLIFKKFKMYLIKNQIMIIFLTITMLANKKNKTQMTDLQISFLYHLIKY